MQEAPKTVHSQIIDKISDVYAEAQKWHEGGTIVNYTPILYRKDKYKVIEAGVVFLRSRYTETNTKSMSWAVLETIETGERFIVTNLHGALIMATYNIPGSNSVEGAAWRVDNVAQMLEKLDELKAKYGDLPTLSTGDYNFNADAQAYKDALRADCAMQRPSPPSAVLPESRPLTRWAHRPSPGRASTIFLSTIRSMFTSIILS